MIVSITYGALGFLADGYTDPFYVRFTTPKQKSMILGTSRAAQGIIPKVLNLKLVGEKFEGEIFNYGFTIIQSPYGKVYYHAIDEKLDKRTKNGLFILAVDPWAFCENKIQGMQFIESELELAKITNFNSYPNYDYLRNAYRESMFELVMNKINPDKTIFLHDDGWLEVTIDTSRNFIIANTKEKISDYKKKIALQSFSKERFYYFNKIVKLLKKHGTVVMVRIPVGKEMFSLENDFFSDFNNRMIDISKKQNIHFLSYKDMDYLYPDGNHLHKSSGLKFSEKLSKDINKILLHE